MIEIDLQQNTPEWLEFRRSKIGASEAPIILGISPYSNSLKLWGEKLGVIPEKESNAFMQRGHDLESRARDLFVGQMGIKFVPKIGISSIHNWMSASFDGISEMGTLVEIKCNGPKNHELAYMGNLPPFHYAQMQHQLFVAEAELGYYFSFDGQDGIDIEVRRDEKYIENLIEKELEFWHCVQNFIPPKTGKNL